MPKLLPLTENREYFGHFNLNNPVWGTTGHAKKVCHTWGGVRIELLVLTLRDVQESAVLKMSL